MSVAHISSELTSELNQALIELDQESNDLDSRPTSPISIAKDIAKSAQRSMLRNGLLALLGKASYPQNQHWEDAMDYCRAVIEDPQDTAQRANTERVRSCSDVYFELLKKFGPRIIEVAREGCAALIDDHYGGNALSIAHIDKKANTERHIHEQKISDIFNRKPGVLAVACYELTVCCSILISAWLPTQRATKFATISHVAVCEDYHAFTAQEKRTRIQMIALAVGAAFEAGGQAVNALVDGTTLQAVGTNDQVTVEATMAWRAVGGCTMPYSGYLWGGESLQDGLIAPEVMMAMHDIMDWRSDIAARNHENGVSAVYGLGMKDPHHTYIEAMLEKASLHPLSGAYAMACIIHLHFTATRYGSYMYRGGVCDPCLKCESLLRDVTLGAGLQWAPMAPPRNFAEGHPFRQLCHSWMDTFETQPLDQCGISWLQYLITTGRIRLFDALVTIEMGDFTMDMDWA
jgi:hypothetical protein